jgi:hypothetical protein
MSKIKRFGEIESVNEDVDTGTVTALAAALTGGALTAAIIADVASWMKQHNYTGVKGFLRALKEWRKSKGDDDVASKF